MGLKRFNDTGSFRWQFNASIDPCRMYNENAHKEEKSIQFPFLKKKKKKKSEHYSPGIKGEKDMHHWT